jgi:hypothetical protein
MYGESVDSRDGSVIERLYEIAESQGGFIATHQAMDAGIPRSTLGIAGRRRREDTPGRSWLGGKAAYAPTSGADGL